jgi:hypothetical protein
MNGRAYRYDGIYDEDPGPAPGSTPVCPICPSDKPHRVVINTGALGGFICESCGTALTPEARGDNARRREMWEHETKRRSA